MIHIIGAGPAGMAAALAAAPSGAAITVVDDNPQPGGQIWRDGPQAALPPMAQQHRAALAKHTNIRVLTGTRVVGLGASHPTDNAPALLLEDADRGWTQHSHRIILCTGARELLLPFSGWTLPGVIGAGAARRPVSHLKKPLTWPRLLHTSSSEGPMNGPRLSLPGSGGAPWAWACAATWASALCHSAAPRPAP